MAPSDTNVVIPPAVTYHVQVVAFEVINPKLAPPPAQAVTVPGWSKTATVEHCAFKPSPAQKIKAARRIGLDFFINI
jgi:hypothetical protein